MNNFEDIRLHSNQMKENIQFDIDDIIAKYEEIQELDEKTKINEIGILNHEILGSYNRIQGLLAIIDIENKENTNPLLRNEILQHGKSTKEALEKLSKKYVQKSNEYINPEEKAGVIINNLKLIQSKDIIGQILVDPKKISETTKIYLQKTREELTTIILKHNSAFPKKENQEYMLARQILNYEKQNKNSDLHIITQINAELVSKFDYFNKIIVPIIDNIKDHAYNPRNDTNNRLKEGLLKKCEITTAPFDSDKYLLVTIQDNGFGMTKDISNNLFNKGITSRDEKEDHGIGLYHVKNLLETKGGDILFNTYLGTGTLFKIKIPYSKKEPYKTYSV